MRRATSLPAGPSVLASLLIMIGLSVPAGAQEMLPATRTTAGIQYASISTHFAEYYPSTVNAWETFSMQGLSADRMWRFHETGTYSLYWGAGLTVLIGGYPEEVDSGSFSLDLGWTLGRR